MKNSNKKYAIYLTIAFVLLFTIAPAVSFGQSLEDALGFTETVNDVPEAPISGLVALGLAVGSFFGYRKFKS
jgi:hypothetical protein